MLRHLRVLSLGFAILLLSHCSDGGGKSKEVTTPSNPSTSTPISTYFGVPASEDGTKSNLITIQKSALNKEFLLQGSLAFQKNYGTLIVNPTGQSLKSRIVTFQEHGKNLLMLESDEGLQPGEEIPAHILLATFPVTKKEGESLTFDFNEGMKNVIISWDWYVSDFSGNDIRPDQGLGIDSSFLRDRKIGQNALTVIQTLSANDLNNLEVTYYVTPYKKNPNYKPINNPGFANLGYFEANPRVQENFGTPFTNITRYDISKPVTYYLSSAIPEKYRQAVREGVLYWNKAFEKEILKVADAPKGMTAPDFEHNIIQWVTHFEGYAYADAQVDPKTGEILHSQVYVISGFADGPRYFDLPRFQRQLNEKKKLDLTEMEQEVKSPKNTASNSVPTSRQIEETKLCRLDINDVFDQFYAQRDVLEFLSPERLDELVQDIIRTVIAHEVGHTLGLRHNFASSTINEWSGEEEEQISRVFLKEGKLPEKFSAPSASVMEYPNFIANLLMGSMIGDPKTEALSYDSYAIQWGYFGSDKKPEDKGIPFCTDTQAGNFVDCGMNDGGRHILERAAYQSTRNLEKIPWLLSEVYLYFKADVNPKTRKPVDESSPSASYLAKSVLMPWFDLMDLLTTKFDILSIVRQHPDLNDVEWKKIDNETLDWTNNELVQAGGTKKVLKLIDPEWFQKTVANLPASFDNILKSETFTKEIPLYEGGTTSFSKEERAYIKQRSRELFEETENKLAYYISLTLEKRPPALLDAVEAIESATAHWADYVINAGGQKDFRYSFKTRSQAVKLLKSQGPLPDWLAQYVPAIAEKLRLKLEAVYGKPIGQIDPRTFPRKDQDGVEAELSLYYALAGGLQK